MTRKRNPAFYQALKDYAKEYLAALRGIYREPQGLPRIQVQRPQISQNSISYVAEVKLDMLKILFDNRIEPSKLQAYHAVEMAMRVDSKVARHLDTLVGTAGFAIRVDIEAVLRRILGQLLDGQTSLVFHEKRFNKLYGAVEDYFYRDGLTLRYLAPLRGFRMDGKTLELEPNLRIIRLPTKEREGFVSLWQQFGGVPGAPQIATGWEECGIELVQEAPKQYGDQPDVNVVLQPQTAAGEQLDLVVAALRLLKAGMVSYGGTLTTSLGWDPFGGVRTTGPSGRPMLHGSSHNLPGKERRPLQRLWRDLRSLPVPRLARLDQAIRRFNFAYERVRPEDKLIDLAIALEALLLKREEDQELSYRLALRGAVLLAEHSKGRESVRALLKKAYDVRSDVVHGQSAPEVVILSSSSLPFHEFVGKVEDVVREAIKRSLVLVKGGRDLIPEVEGNILQEVPWMPRRSVVSGSRALSPRLHRKDF